MLFFNSWVALLLWHFWLDAFVFALVSLVFNSYLEFQIIVTNVQS